MANTLQSILAGIVCLCIFAFIHYVRLPDDTTGNTCLLYTSPSPRDKRQSRMPSSA